MRMEHNGGERRGVRGRRVDKTKGGDKTRQERRREVKKGKEFLTDRPGGRGGGRGDTDRMTALI